MAGCGANRSGNGSPGLESLCANASVGGQARRLRRIVFRRRWIEAIAKQKKHLTLSLYEILQIVSASSLEQVVLEELLVKVNTRDERIDIPNQLEINYSQLDSRGGRGTDFSAGPCAAYIVNTFKLNKFLKRRSHTL
jgi:hypothetical protein